MSSLPPPPPAPPTGQPVSDPDGPLAGDDRRWGLGDMWLGLLVALVAVVVVGVAILGIGGYDDMDDVLEAYEQDLPFLRYGQAVALESEALPGEAIPGTVTLVEPTVDVATRTAAVRVHVLDPDRALEADHAASLDRFATLLERSVDPTGSGVDTPESGRPPGLEGPAEGVLVEGLGARAVVRVDGEVGDVVRHASHASGAPCGRLALS